MRCLKNPRRKPRLVQAANCLERCCEINMTVIANLLNALNELYPKRFGKSGMEQFLIHHLDSVEYLEADKDVEVQDYRESAMLVEMPYVVRKDVEGIVRKIAALDAGNRKVMESGFYVEKLVSNAVLLLMTLHADYGFSEIRILRVMERWRNGAIANGEEWLARRVEFERDRAKDRRAIEDILLEQAKKPRTTVREQLDARRELEALKAYQDGVKNGS